MNQAEEKTTVIFGGQKNIQHGNILLDPAKEIFYNVFNIGNQISKCNLCHLI